MLAIPRDDFIDAFSDNTRIFLTEGTWNDASLSGFRLCEAGFALIGFGWLAAGWDRLTDFS